MITLSALNKWRMVCAVVLVSILSISMTRAAERPHIIMILADDMGWDDVSFHGSDQIPTPNIDRLAHEGIILNNYYVQQLCTPSRAALMTGRYPIHTGLQHGVIVGSAPYGLGLEEKILPQYLRELGYRTHIVGKWHLGFFAEEYMPTKRGFDSFLGYLLGAGDYWDHTAEIRKVRWGLDFRRNMELVRTAYGQYSTELFTNESLKIIREYDDKTKPMFLYLAHQAVHNANSFHPLEAPAKYINRMKHIKDDDRRQFAAMTVAMDDSIGEVIRALNETGMLNDSIVVFMSDNGGAAAHYGSNVASNWPLRGMKNTLWEGGIRVPAFIWSPLLANKPRVSYQLMHITDWLPTLLNAIGAPVTNITTLDGVNQWPALSKNVPSARKEILHNIDYNGRVYSIRVGNFKLIAPNWNSKHRFGWYTPDSVLSSLSTQASKDDSFTSAQDLDCISSEEDNAKYADMPLEEMIALLNAVSAKYYGSNVETLVVDCGKKPPDAPTNCRPHTPCLYHIPSDPCEYKNIYSQQVEVAKMLYARMLKYRASYVPPKNLPEDPAGYPSNNGGAWGPWIKLDQV